MQNVKYYIRDPWQIVYGIFRRFAPYIESDELYLKILFYLRMHKRLNLKDPQTFSEKMQWLKLYHRISEHTIIVDKYAVKTYLSERIGTEHIIPTLGVWDRPEDIEWERLPEKFVLKTTHGGGSVGVIICKDKGMFDKQKAISALKKALKQDIYVELREWPYKNVKKRVMAEPFLESANDEVQDLRDYKFFCFNGVPKFCQVVSGRNQKTCLDFFDLNWQHQDFHEPKKYPFSEHKLKKPVRFEDMVKTAETLSLGHPFLRVDFYELKREFYVGELTFFPTSGMGGFSPQEWDNKFGEWIELPNVKTV